MKRLSNIGRRDTCLASISSQFGLIFKGLQTSELFLNYSLDLFLKNSNSSQLCLFQELFGV